MTSDSSEPREISDPAKIVAAPLVSVKMITYRHELYIRQAIDSVLAQETDFAYELVIGEDCSPDNTRDIVLAYQAENPDRVRVIVSDVNVGMRANNWRTIRACRGKYMAFCEGDDYWTDPHKLQKQVAWMETRPDAAMVAHRAQAVDAAGNALHMFPGEQPEMLRPRDVIRNGGGFFASNSIMIHSSLLEEVPEWFRQSPVGDLAIANLALNRGGIGFLNDVMCAYRVNAAGSWSERLETDTAFAINHFRRLSRTYLAIRRHERQHGADYLYMALQSRWWVLKTILARQVKRPLRRLLSR